VGGEKEKERASKAGDEKKKKLIIGHVLCALLANWPSILSFSRHQ
jgi:hypothetical protein